MDKSGSIITHMYTHTYIYTQSHILIFILTCKFVYKHTPQKFMVMALIPVQYKVNCRVFFPHKIFFPKVVNLFSNSEKFGSHYPYLICFSLKYKCHCCSLPSCTHSIHLGWGSTPCHMGLTSTSPTVGSILKN